MSKFDYSKTDYIDVAARIVEFRQQYPQGSLQPADVTVPFRVEQVGGDTYIVVIAAAYRTADDARPGIGMAYEPYPGKTPYTRHSELQNAETSAWGRAIVAALAADTKRGIASAEEVRNRQAERDQPPPPPAPGLSMDELNAAISCATTMAELETVRTKALRDVAAGGYKPNEIDQIKTWMELAKVRLAEQPDADTQAAAEQGELTLAGAA